METSLHSEACYQFCFVCTFGLLDFGSGTDIATHLVVVLVHVLLLVGAMLFKKAQGSVVSSQICMKFGRIVMYQLMKDSDF